MAQPAAVRTESQQTKRARLRDIIAERCFSRGKPFQLASGRWSDFYFNMKPAMLDAEGIDLLADLILERIAGTDAKFIGGLVMGSVPVSVAVTLKSRSTKTPLQAFWVRKEVKDHGAKSRIDGYLVDGAKVIMVEDVTTTGGSVLQAIEEVKKRGCTIAAVITIVDRLEGAKEHLAEAGIELIALYDAKDFMP